MGSVWPQLEFPAVLNTLCQLSELVQTKQLDKAHLNHSYDLRSYFYSILESYLIWMDTLQVIRGERKYI